jgi:hypothetical protein
MYTYFPRFGKLYQEKSGNPVPAKNVCFKIIVLLPCQMGSSEKSILVVSSNHVENRVTRLGEFSPIGRLFTLGSFEKNKEIEQIIGLPFSTVKAVN